MTRGSEFGVFANAPVVRYLVAPRAFSRAELGRLEEIAKEWGAKGLAYLVGDESGEVRSPIAKFLSEARARRARRPRPARPRSSPPATRRPSRACSAACARTSAASSSSPTRGVDAFHWVLDFPLFERDEDRRRPGRSCTTRSRPRSRAARTGSRAIRGSVLGQHYDLIWNGWELGSGSIRIHRAGPPAGGLPRRWGSREEEQRAKFGFLLDALAMGAPPHGGFAMGIDRFVALHRGRAGHPPGDRVPEGLERLRPAHGRADAVPGAGAARARDPARSSIRIKPEWASADGDGILPATRACALWRRPVGVDREA